MEQIVDIPVPSGGLHDPPDPGSSSSSAVSRDFSPTGPEKSPRFAASQSESEGAR